MNLEPVSSCPVCGGTGPHVIRDTRDYALGVPGTWSYRRCERCSSLWLDPCPAASEIPALYPEEYYTHQNEDPLSPPGRSPWRRMVFSCKLGAVAHRFGYPALRESAPQGFGFQLGRWMSRLPGVAARVGFLTRFLASKPNGRLLDVGAANGGFLRLMRDLGWEVTGIEPDFRAAQLAQQHGLRILDSSVEDAELPAESVDAITLSHVLEHTRNPTLALAKLATWLRPGGVLVSISPNPDGWLARRFAGQWRQLDAPRHLVLPSLAGYAHMLSALGMETATWTSLRWFYPGYRQSLGIRTRGAPLHYVKRLRPTLATWYVRLLSWFRADLGEEIVCMAVKPQVPAASAREINHAVNIGRP